MDVLFAPWRMRYIEYTKIERDQECFICKGYRERNDEDNLVVYKGERVVVLMNKFPYNTGHLLVAPARHVPDLESLTDEELCVLFKAVKLSIQVLKAVFSPDGFNIGINLGRVAGAGLESHLHVHVVPRWNGDTNFMPVIGSTKVIPEALRDTYHRIVAQSAPLSEAEEC
ncbi:MAG: HIT domain-containing protein [Infirmifilum sp.]